MIPLIVITGPTAAGKSGAALALAQKIGAEIISADSLQVYRWFDIGSDKPLPRDLKAVRHHLISIIDPDEEFSAGHFNTLACEAARDIHARGKPVIVCGGTGLYIKALLENFACGIPKDEAALNRIKTEFPEPDTSRIYKRLQEVDAESAKNISPSDRYRIERALEVFISSGIPLSEHNRNKTGERRFDCRHFILNMERDSLYKRIGERVDDMIERGLPEETKKILGMGYRETLKPFQALGYAQMTGYLRGETGFDAAVESIKKETRHFAKRQLTWLRGVKDGEWINCVPESSPLEIAEQLEKNLVCY